MEWVYPHSGTRLFLYVSVDLLIRKVLNEDISTVWVDFAKM